MESAVGPRSQNRIHRFVERDRVRRRRAVSSGGTVEIDHHSRQLGEEVELPRDLPTEARRIREGPDDRSVHDTAVLDLGDADGSAVADAVPHGDLFTPEYLVELMVVVVIIGILAVLGSFGVRKYLGAAKSAEATNTIGAINRQAVSAYQRESAPSEMVVGKSSTSTMHQLCASSAAVPATDAAIQNKKYSANPAAGQDYQIGAGATPTGWACLRFEMSEPQYYRYKYTLASTPALATNVTPPGGAQWLADGRRERALEGHLIEPREHLGGASERGRFRFVADL